MEWGIAVDVFVLIEVCLGLEQRCREPTLPTVRRFVQEGCVIPVPCGQNRPRLLPQRSLQPGEVAGFDGVKEAFRWGWHAGRDLGRRNCRRKRLRTVWSGPG